MSYLLIRIFNNIINRLAVDTMVDSIVTGTDDSAFRRRVRRVLYFPYEFFLWALVVILLTVFVWIDIWDTIKAKVGER